MRLAGGSAVGTNSPFSRCTKFASCWGDFCRAVGAPRPYPLLPARNAQASTQPPERSASCQSFLRLNKSTTKVCVLGPIQNPGFAFPKELGSFAQRLGRSVFHGPFGRQTLDVA